jgi:hypothetical protein
MWKRLTSTTGAQIDVNMDTVAYLHPAQQGATTTIYFTAAGSDGKLSNISVKGSIDHVHAAPPLDAVGKDKNV